MKEATDTSNAGASGAEARSYRDRHQPHQTFRQRKCCSDTLDAVIYVTKTFRN